MRKIKELLLARNRKKRLAVQFSLLLLGTNLTFLGLCFVLQYVNIRKTLINNYEDQNIERMEQAEHNIENFLKQTEDIVKKYI